MRAARGRRYGYAALRTIRRGLRSALHAHLERSVGDRPYASELEEIRALYTRALRWMKRRFGRLDLSDPRAEP